MTIRESQNIKKRVEKEYNYNCEKIDDCTYRLRDIEASDFDTKILLTIAFSMIPWLFFAIFSKDLANSQIIPISLIQPFCVSISLIIGLTVMFLLVSKSKCQERLKQFSNAKTQQEKVNESTKQEIEKKKLMSLNCAIKQVYDEVNAYENFMTSYFKDFEEEKKSRSKEEIEKKVKELEGILLEKQNQLNIIAAKCSLKDKFWRERDTFTAISNIIMFGMLGGLLLMMFYGMPVICLNQTEPQIETSFLGVLAPFFIGDFITSLYFIYRKKIYTRSFQEFNEELKEFRLTDKRNYDEDQQFDVELEESIKTVAIVKLRLEKTREELFAIN